MRGMSRRPARFTQADVTRALKAAKGVDENMTVEISQDGTIRIVPEGPKKPTVPREVIL